MSRIGKKPIKIPEGVEVTLNDNIVTVKGPNATLQQELHPAITMSEEDGSLIFDKIADTKENRALHGLMRSLIYNMVVGVKEGFEKKLEIKGVGYRAQKNGSTLVLNVGYSHSVEFAEPEGITFDVPTPTQILVKGADKQLVGEMAARIRAVRVPDPYHGKGIKYADEILRLKEGKTGS